MKRKSETEIKAIKAKKIARQRAEDSLVELIKHVFKQLPGPLKNITYGDLAERIGYLGKHGKIISYGMGPVLGGMRRLLDDLSNGREVPDIQSLAVSKTGPLKGLPGEGIQAIWPGYSKLPEEEKIDRVQKEYRRIAEFGSRWNDVLSSLSLPVQKGAPKKAPKEVPEEHQTGGNYGGGGESPEHNDLKIFVSKNPELVGANKSDKSVTEYLFPSQDAVDVLFKNKKRWIAVEVKSRISRGQDYERGLYQCVKYYALLEAMKKDSNHNVPKEIQVVLLLEKTLPKEYEQVAKELNIKVIENIKPPGKKV